MSDYRDELEAPAGTADILLQALDPPDLARRFLAHAASVFNADGGFFALDPRGPRPLLATLEIDPTSAWPLAAELISQLSADGPPTSIAPPPRDAASAIWRSALAVRVGSSENHHGVLALFSYSADSLDPVREGRLLGLMTRRAGIALDHAARFTHVQRQADRLAVQAEQIERVFAALELHSREIERSLAARSRFLAAASHELRTPINAILGYNQLLNQGVYGTLTGRQAAVVGKIAASADQLLTLVNDILDLSKIDAGKVDIRREPVDLPTLVRDAAGIVEIRARAKGLSLLSDFPSRPLVLETDPARVRQILVNLLSNAVKFTPRGSITVQAKHVNAGPATAAAERPGIPAGPDGWVRITVRDTGIGIPTEKLTAIFGEFVQISPAAANPREGTGLGLAISVRLARLLGGDLTVESEVGVHSTFTLLLPFPHPPLEATPEPDYIG